MFHSAYQVKRKDTWIEDESRVQITKFTADWT